MTFLGLFAGTLTTLSFLPQVMRTLRTRSARDLSWGWLLLFGAGVTSWLLYGLFTADLPVTASNGITVVLVGLLAGLKARQRAAVDR